MKLKFTPFFFFIMTMVTAQQIRHVDFETAKAELVFGDLKNKEVSGVITYKFKILKDVDSIFIDGKQMMFSNIKLRKHGFNADVGYDDVKHINNTKQLIIYNTFKKDVIYELTFNFSSQPQKAMYFMDWNYQDGNQQIWTQGQGKYTSNWLPSIDDMNEKVVFDLNITFNNDFEVIANGKLTDKEIHESTSTWRYDMQKPMSSYLLALVIGKYSKNTAYSKSGIPLHMYYYPKDSLKFEPTYRYTKQMFDFLESEIGVAYPWQNYKQVPVKDFLYAGMENTSTTIFSDAFVIDSIAFVDKNYVNVNAHELAHQWFGNLVTASSGTHHWLQEGFATYYALLAERDIFGEDYYYWTLYTYAQELLVQDKAGGSTSLLNPKSSSTTFYKKGAWVLHMLRAEVGDRVFRTGVKNYLKKYQFRNVETDDFITEIEKVYGRKLKRFKKDWCVSKVLLYDAMEAELRLKSSVLKGGILNKTSVTLSTETPALSATDKIKIRFIEENPNKIEQSHFNNSLKVRQAIAKRLNKIPRHLKSDYESFLKDASYTTIEVSLYNLWNNFNDDRAIYLEITKDIQGFNDKNIRLLWLTLALLTDNFEMENKTRYYQELVEYTGLHYGFQIRQNAFQYLIEIQACNTACIENLEQAQKHHNWRFSKFAKEALKQLSPE